MARYSHYDMAGKVKSLKANLDERYKEFFCIIQELLQNADDAKASQVIIGELDYLANQHELCNIPGIFILNNGPVSDSDLDHIFSIADSNKDEDEGKIGKFGLGMKSVFHLCETFFIFGHQTSGITENMIAEFFDPWDNGEKDTDINAMPEPHPKWRKEFNNHSTALWETVNNCLKKYHNFGENWFALWLPLRQRNQCSGGSDALLDYYPLESNAQDWFTEDDFRKVSRMMPFFKHLRKIQFISGKLERFGQLELIPDKQSSFTGKSKNEWSGTIISDKQILGKQYYHGWEFFGNEKLEQLRQTKDWPTARHWDDSKRQWNDQKDKTQPHAAICYCSEELAPSITGNLVMQECVFLPLSEMQQTLPLSLPVNLTISFHGQYFVDAGRRRYKLEDDKSVNDIKIEWNKTLRSELLLPKVLQTFADFFAKWDVEKQKTILQKFIESNFWENSKDDICRKSQFLLCLTKNGWTWKREEATQEFILLPDVNRPELLQSVFQRINKNNILVQENAPRLGIRFPSPWPEEQIQRLWDAASVLDEKTRYDSITLDFLERALKIIGNTAGQLSSIQKYLKDIVMGQYRNAREQLGRILHDYPHCCINFAKDNWTTSSFNLWKKIFLLAEYCLPLDLPKEENSIFKYSEKDLLKFLPKLEEELANGNDPNCRAVIRDLVCSIFENSDINWHITPLGKYKLFVIQEKIFSFAELKEMYSSKRLFRAGGDVQTSTALQKAVKWNFETLHDYYRKALESILKVETFNQEKHVPEIFRSKPNLSEPAARIDLLKKLKSDKIIEPYYHAVRYLLHGQKELFEDIDDIEIPSIPSDNHELFDIGIKLLGELNEGKPQFSISSDLIAEFSDKEMNSFGIRKLRFEDIFGKLKNLSPDKLEVLCSDWRTPTSWQCLTEYLNAREDLRLLASLPIWFCKNNKYVPLSSANCFLENEISIPHCISNQIDQLNISEIKQIQLLTNKTPCKIWNDEYTVDYCTKMPVTRECIEDIWEAVENKDKWDYCRLEKLFAYPLFETQTGKWIPFLQITSEVSISAADIYCQSQLTDASIVRWKKLAVQGTPEKKNWTERLATVLSQDPEFVWGELPEDLCSADKFKKLFSSCSIMPVMRLLEDLKDKIDADELIRKIMGTPSSGRLEKICTFVSKQYEKDKDSMFMEFLKCFVAQAKGNAVDWKEIFLPDVSGQCRLCSSLVRQADGVDSKYVLHPDLKVYFDENATIDEKGNDSLPKFTDSANLTQEQYISLTSKSGNILQNYFASWPEDLYPAVGAFMLLIAGRNQTVIQASKGFLLRDPKLVREKISNDFAFEFEKYNSAVKIYQGKSAYMTSLAGTKISVPLQNESQLDSLLIGEDCYNCRLDSSPEPFVFFAFRMINPNTLDKETCVKLLINTAKRLVKRFNEPTENVPELFSEMKSVEQFDLQTTRALILKELPTILRQMNLPCDNELKSFLREWNNNNKYKTQAEQENKSDLSEYDQKFKDLLNELQELFEKFADVRKETLSAIRRRISTAEYGYELSSIPFELFQNADDAAVELQMMKAIPEHSKTAHQAFVIELTDQALNVIHWGRPINQYQYQGFDHKRGEMLGFGDDLQKMLLMGVSDKSDTTITRTGKFGLGFKSIFLLTDMPLVASNRLRFSIQGGLLPQPAEPGEQETLQEIIDRYNAGTARVTVFHLPLRPEVKFDLDKFKSAAPLLVRFARKINEIRIVDHSDDITFRADPDDQYDIWDLGEIQLATGRCNGLPVSLPIQTSTIWVTAPTQIVKNFGFAINGNFNLDVGRNQLLSAPENSSLAVKSAEKLFEKLEQMQTDASPQFWRNLWNLFSNGDNSGTWAIMNTEKATAQVLKGLFWGSRENPAGYGKFLQHHKVLPTGLPGKFTNLTSIEQIRYAADEQLSKYWLLFEDFVQNAGIKTGEIIGSAATSALGQIYAINYLQNYSLLTLLKETAEKNPNLSPEMINLKSWDDFIGQRESPLQNISIKFRFLNRKGKYCPAMDLLIPGNDKEDESLRAAFAPDDVLISPKYDQDALHFFRSIRGKMSVSAEALAQWSIQAQSIEKRNAVCRYLAEGDLQNQLAEILRIRLSQENWMRDAFKKNPDNLGLKKLFIYELRFVEQEDSQQTNVQTQEEDENTEENSMVDQDTQAVQSKSETAKQAQQYPDSFWMETYENWNLIKDDNARKYNRKVYGTDILEPFPLELKTPDDRDRWMALFAIGASQSLGRTKMEQHTGFVSFCKSKGYWDTFISPKIVSSEWMEIIDSHIECNNSNYYHWMRLYPSIYLFAKYADQYVEMFSQWKNELSLSSWHDLAEFRNNPNYNGLDYKMPDLKLGLGNLGMHFVFRELYRSNTLRVSGLERYCFVHSERNRTFFVGDQINSETMYNQLSEYLDDPTFDGQFDIAFETIERKKCKN